MVTPSEPPTTSQVAPVPVQTPDAGQLAHATKLAEAQAILTAHGVQLPWQPLSAYGSHVPSLGASGPPFSAFTNLAYGITNSQMFAGGAGGVKDVKENETPGGADLKDGKDKQKRAREKTPAEAAWQECNALAKKLGLLHTQGNDIKRQIEEEGNIWSWASTEKSNLSGVLNSHISILNESNSTLITSKLAVLITAKKGDANAASFLDDFKKRLQFAIMDVHVVVTQLVKMHYSKIGYKPPEFNKKTAKKKTTKN